MNYGLNCRRDTRALFVILSQQQEQTEKLDAPQTASNPHYIVDLIAKVTRVAVKTVPIVKSLDD